GRNGDLVARRHRSANSELSRSTPSQYPRHRGEPRAATAPMRLSLLTGFSTIAFSVGPHDCSGASSSWRPRECVVVAMMWTGGAAASRLAASLIAIPPARPTGAGRAGAATARAATARCSRRRCGGGPRSADGVPGEVLATEVVRKAVSLGTARGVEGEGVERLVVLGDLLGAVGPLDHTEVGDLRHLAGEAGPRCQRCPE